MNDVRKPAAFRIGPDDGMVKPRTGHKHHIGFREYRVGGARAVHAAHADIQRTKSRDHV